MSADASPPKESPPPATDSPPPVTETPETAVESSLPKGHPLAQAWLVILLALGFGAILASLQAGVGPRIRQNIKNETLAVVPVLIAGADGTKTNEMILPGPGDQPTSVYQAFDETGQNVGWVLKGESQGFVDKIELLVGLDAELEQLTGIYVLAQKETPGLGDWILRPSFQESFAGLPASTPVTMVKGSPNGPTEVSALTGATVSSESVATAVNEAVAALRPQILSRSQTTAALR